MTQDAEALSERGLAIYEEKLRPLLEPAYANKYIAIHVETEEYALGESSGDALRTLRKHHPEGWLVTLKIGAEPEWGLAARLLVGQMMGRQSLCGGIGTDSDGYYFRVMDRMQKQGASRKAHSVF